MADPFDGAIPQEYLDALQPSAAEIAQQQGALMPMPTSPNIAPPQPFALPALPTGQLRPQPQLPVLPQAPTPEMTADALLQEYESTIGGLESDLEPTFMPDIPEGDVLLQEWHPPLAPQATSIVGVVPKLRVERYDALLDARRRQAAVQPIPESRIPGGTLSPNPDVREGQIQAVKQGLMRDMFGRSPNEWGTSYEGPVVEPAGTAVKERFERQERLTEAGKAITQYAAGPFGKPFSPPRSVGEISETIADRTQRALGPAPKPLFHADIAALAWGTSDGSDLDNVAQWAADVVGVETGKRSEMYFATLREVTDVYYRRLSEQEKEVAQPRSPEKLKALAKERARKQLGVAPGPEADTGLYGRSPEQLRAIMGVGPNESLSRRQSLLYVALETRTAPHQKATLYDQAEIIGLLTGDEARTDGESHQDDWAWVAEQLAGVTSVPLQGINREVKGNRLAYYPESYAENPSYWDDVLERGSPEEVARAEAIGRRANDMLAYKAARKSRVLQEAAHDPDWLTGAANLPKSAVRWTVFPVQIAFASISAIANGLTAIGEMTGEAAAGGEFWDNQRARDYYDEAMRARETIVPVSKHLVKMVANDAGSVVRMLSGSALKPIDDEAYHRTTLEWELDPMRPIFMIAQLASGTGAVTGAMGGLLRAGKMATITERLAQAGAMAGKGSHAAISLGAWIRGGGKAWGWAGRKVAETRVAGIEAKLQTLYKEAGGPESIAREVADINSKYAAMLEDAPKELRPEINAAAQRELGPYLAIERAQQQLWRNLAALSGMPGYGAFFKRFILSPSAQKFPQMLELLRVRMEGKAGVEAMDLMRPFEKMIDRNWRELGITKDEAYGVAAAMVEGIGDVGALTNWHIDRPFASWGQPVVESLKAKPGRKLKLSQAGEAKTIAQLQAEAEAVGRPLDEHVGRVVQNALGKRLPQVEIPENLPELLKQRAQQQHIELHQAAFKWYGEQLQQLRDGGTRLPRVPGLSEEAVKFQMGMEFTLKMAGIEAGAESISFGQVFDRLISNSPVLASMKRGSVEQMGMALGIMKELRPQIVTQGLPEVTLRMSRGGKHPAAEISAKRLMEDWGQPVTDVARFMYESGIEYAQAGLLSVKTLREMSTRYMHRKWRTMDDAEIMREINRFVNASDMSKDLPKAERLEVAERMKKEMSSHVGTGEADIGIAFIGAVLGDGLDALKYRSRFRDFKFPGEAGRRMHGRLYQTGPDAMLQGITKAVKVRSYAQALRMLRSEAETAGTVLQELLESAELSATSQEYLRNKMGTVPDAQALPLERMRVAMDLLANVESFTAPPGMNSALLKTLKARGWKPASDAVESMGLGADWAATTYLHPETSYWMQNYGQRLRTTPNKWRAVTTTIKQALIGFQSAPWIRDVMSTVAILGPIHGLHPGSHGYTIAGRIIEGQGRTGTILQSIAGSSSVLAEIGAEGAQGLRDGLGALAHGWGKLAKESKRSGGGVDYLGILHEAGKAAIKFNVIPGKTKAGKWLLHQRGMTDLLPRGGVLALKVSEEIMASPELFAKAESVLRNYGLKRTPKTAEALLKAVDDAAASVRTATLKNLAKSQLSKAERRAWANREAAKVVDAVIADSYVRLPKDKIDAINESVKQVSIDYNDKSQFLDYITSNPFGPIFATFSTKAVPMVFGNLVKHPVKTMLMRGGWDAVNNFMWHTLGGQGAWSEVEKQEPPWQISTPFLRSSTWRFGNYSEMEMESPAGADLMWFSPLAMTMDAFNPLLSPGASVVSAMGQAAMGQTPRAMFPIRREEGQTAGGQLLKGGALGAAGAAIGGLVGGRGGALLGALAGGTAGVFSGQAGGQMLANPEDPMGDQTMQATAALLGQSLPGWSAIPAVERGIYKGTEALGWGGTEATPGVRIGPGPAGVGAPGTQRKLWDAAYGSNRPHQPAMEPGLAALSMAGFKATPLSQRMSIGPYVVPYDITRKRKEETGKAPPTASPFERAYNNLRDNASGLISQTRERLQLDEQDLANYRKQKRASKPGLEVGRSDRTHDILGRIDMAERVSKQALHRTDQILGELQELTYEQFYNQPPEKWLYARTDLDRMVSVLSEEVARRLRLHMNEILAKGFDVESTDERVQDILQPLAETMRVGSITTDVWWGDEATKQYSWQTDFADKWRDGTLSFPDIMTVQQYQNEQPQRMPEMLIRSAVKRPLKTKLGLEFGPAEPLMPED